MRNLPTARPCVAPIQFFCHDDGPVNLNGLNIEGGTAFFLERRKRYLVTARHVWEGFCKLALSNRGRRYGAFVYAGKFLPLDPAVRVAVSDHDHDVIVLKPG
jgi:hypothetical protein